MLKYKPEVDFFLKPLIYIICIVYSISMSGMPKGKHKSYSGEHKSYFDIETEKLMAQSDMMLHDKVPGEWKHFQEIYVKMKNPEEKKENGNLDLESPGAFKDMLFSDSSKSPMKQKSFDIIYEIVSSLENNRLLKQALKAYTEMDIKNALSDKFGYFRFHGLCPGFMACYYNIRKYDKNKSVQKENYSFLQRHDVLLPLEAGYLSELRDYAHSIGCGKMEAQYGLSARQFQYRSDLKRK